MGRKILQEESILLSKSLNQTDVTFVANSSRTGWFDSVNSEQVVLPLDIAPLPVWHPGEVLPAHPEHHVKVGVAEVLLQVAPVHVAGQPVVGGEEQVQRVDVGRLHHLGQVVVAVLRAARVAAPLVEVGRLLRAARGRRLQALKK